MSSSPPPAIRTRLSRTRLSSTLPLLTAAVLGGGALTACAADDDADASTGAPSVVASTTVYADIAEQVAGNNATVESVISDPTADPHSYEASPADAAAVAASDLVIYNGAGYDGFVDMALENADDVPVVRAVDEFERVTEQMVAEHDHGDHDEHGGHSHPDGVNEHVWFSLPTAAAVAQRVADELSDLDPENSGEYRSNAQRFADSLTPLEEQMEQIHDRGHFPYAQTERVGGHLFDAAHLTDLTPRGFLAAIEDDTDPSAADFSALLDLVSEQRVTFLAFNTQTETPVTARIRDAAADAGVVVVEVAETLPEGSDYLTWITDIVDRVSDALSDATPATGGH